MDTLQKIVDDLYRQRAGTAVVVCGKRQRPVAVLVRYADFISLQKNAEETGAAPIPHQVAARPKRTRRERRINRQNRQRAVGAAERDRKLRERRRHEKNRAAKQAKRLTVVGGS